MKKCGDCKFNYPNHLLSEMMINGGYTESICAICALIRSNEGLPKKLQRTKFGGEMAEQMRLDAIEWRKNHA